MQKSQPFWVWYIPSMLGGCSFFRLIFPADFSISPHLVGEILSMSPENCSRWLRNLLIKAYWSCFLGNVRARFLAQIVAQTCLVYWCSLLKVPFFVGLNIPHKSFSLKHHFTSLFFPADPLPGNHYYYLPIFVGWPGWPPQQDAIVGSNLPPLRLQLHPAGAGGHSKMDAGDMPCCPTVATGWCERYHGGKVSDHDGYPLVN